MIDRIQPPRAQPGDKSATEKAMKTKPFDLTAAINGAKLVTMDGREAKFIAYVPEADEPERVIALIDGLVITFYEDGVRHKKLAKFGIDLFLAVQTHSINGHEYPEPEKVGPRGGTPYWYPAVTKENMIYTAAWDGGKTDTRLLKRGLVHLTREAAEAHARAIILAGGGEV